MLKILLILLNNNSKRRIYMTRHEIIERIGSIYHTSNIEGGEYSYIKEAGSRNKLKKALGHDFNHFMLDIRFESGNSVVLIETKQNFVDSDSEQLAEYVAEEKALHPEKKIIAILANTNNNDIRVWKTSVDEDHIIEEETVLDSMEHYVNLFAIMIQNDREAVLKNTLALNDLLHKKDIDEAKRSQFVGTTLLYVKKMVKQTEAVVVDEKLRKYLASIWKMMDANSIRAAIGTTLDDLLDDSENKKMKIELLQQNVLNDQKVKKLKHKDWIDILDSLLFDIYRFINADSSEGQDILNIFFIAFNKYTGKADKNQAFTPDHITEFMCRVTDVDHSKVVLDATCGSGSFLVQAMVKEIAECRKGRTEAESLKLIKEVKEKHIYGIENEEKAYGLATTNMLIHGDGNSNIKFASCFECEEFIRAADPDIILMNPPYNAKPIGIPDKYKQSWGKAKDGKEDPTKGYVFVQFLSDVVKSMNEDREKEGKPKKEVKLAVLLPVSAAIGTSSEVLANAKKDMLKDNRLEAVFTLPDEIFYPGASADACCMVFTLGKSHKNPDDTINETFFGYYKDDGFKKKKGLGRIEQFDGEGNSRWKEIESKWLRCFRNKTVIEGFTSTAIVTAEDEWLCEAFMETDYSTLTSSDFQQSINNFLAYQIKEGKIYES